MFYNNYLLDEKISVVVGEGYRTQEQSEIGIDKDPPAVHLLIHNIIIYNIIINFYFSRPVVIKDTFR